MSQTLALGLAGAALVPLLLGGLPIAFSRLAASLLYLVLAGADPSIVGSNMFWFLNSGIYGGWFTPTEAAAVAVGYSAVFAATLYRNAALSSPVETVAAAGRIAAAILLIMAATGVVAYIVTENRIPYHVSGWIDASGLTPFQFLLAVNLLLIALGLFLEIISVILITLPIFLPVLAGLGIDPVHFAIIMVINMELAVIIPPNPRRAP